MNIELHIERLILDGIAVERRHRAALQSAVEAELTRLLLSNGLGVEFLAGALTPSLSTQPIYEANGANAARLGTQIAQAVHGGIGDRASVQRNQ